MPEMRYGSLCSGIEAASVAWEGCRSMPRRTEIQSRRQQHGRTGDALDREKDSRFFLEKERTEK